ncbi:MAG: chemotaxis protein CheW [Prochloraceae cyanobacterium]|nr:chemotaxis protein CheW [Prochloraceae cyanobacterium]
MTTSTSIEQHQLCTFYLDKFFFGIGVEKVQEIVRYQKITRVPLAPPEVRGLMNLRNQIVTAIDLRDRLDLPEYRGDMLPINVVVKIDEEMISLLVDDVGDVLEVSQEQFESSPETLTGKVSKLIRGAYKLEERLLLILDVEKVVDLTGY